MLDYLQIKGGNRLEGTVKVSGAKNSALPLIIATLLTDQVCELHNVPDLEDTVVLLHLLESLGAESEFSDNRVSTSCRSIRSAEAPYARVKALRASFWVLGPLLARYGKAEVALPGGDAIGSRPVNLHLEGLVRFGADIRLRNGIVFATSPGGLSGARIVLDYPSVGATHQLLMTAVLAHGETVITGAAREPEVAELATFLGQMGAEIEGAGTSEIVIRGRKELGGATQHVEGDRIEAATYLIAAAVTGGRVTVRGITRDKFGEVLTVLEEAGGHILSAENTVTLSCERRLDAVSFATKPFPGVATDVQPLLMAAMTTAAGTSRIKETVFDNRFGHVAEFRRLGADISLSGRLAHVRGVESLSGAPVEATDIRAAAGLVIMGLTADGVTQLTEIHHLDRGYERLVEKMVKLGANVSRVPLYEGKELIFGC